MSEWMRALLETGVLKQIDVQRSDRNDDEDIVRHSRIPRLLARVRILVNNGITMRRAILILTALFLQIVPITAQQIQQPSHADDNVHIEFSKSAKMTYIDTTSLPAVDVKGADKVYLSVQCAFKGKDPKKIEAMGLSFRVVSSNGHGISSIHPTFIIVLNGERMIGPLTSDYGHAEFTNRGLEQTVSQLMNKDYLGYMASADKVEMQIDDVRFTLSPEHQKAIAKVCNALNGK